MRGERACGSKKPQHSELLSDWSDLYQHLVTLAFAEHGLPRTASLADCAQPGMSMAAVAMAHGINAKLLRRWVHEAEMKPRSEVVRADVVDGAKAQEPDTVFVPVSLPAPESHLRRPQTFASSCGVD